MNPLNKFAVYRHLATLPHAPAEDDAVYGHRKPKKHGSAERHKDKVPSLVAHKRPDMTWKDHLVMLLHIGAEIEHSLMVQYLYAAYSLGGTQVPPDRREMVKRWQDDILAVAKEEMGHLLTVQNILTLIGQPINLARMDLPWDIPFYPFPFQLEPLSLDSVACYVYAEMPSEQEFKDALARSPEKRLLHRYQRFQERDREDIVKRASRLAGKNGAHRVGGLYDEIAELLGNRDRFPDRMFQDNTYAFQASVDDWGRGYQPRPRRLDAGGSFEGEPPSKASNREAHVMVDRVATRAQAVKAIELLSQQGESPALADKESDELSHFDRFLDIYQEFVDIKGEWEPARKVPRNPTTVRDPDPNLNTGYISARQSRDWANLFNLRYRILLRYLAHTFRLARDTPGSEPNLRAMLMHRVFGEMYNLKTIAGVLVRLPQHDRANKGACAGPPFEMPYTLDLAGGELERWITHFDLLRSSQRICKRLLARTHKDTRESAYLKALFEIDSQAAEWMKSIRHGLMVAQGVTP